MQILHAERRKNDYLSGLSENIRYICSLIIKQKLNYNENKTCTVSDSRHLFTAD